MPLFLVSFPCPDGAIWREPVTADTAALAGGVGLGLIAAQGGPVIGALVQVTVLAVAPDDPAPSVFNAGDL